MKKNREKKIIDLIFEIGILATVVFIALQALPVSASELVEGRILKIQPDSGIVTLLDFFDGTKKEIILQDTKGVKKNSAVRMWLLDEQGTTLKAKKIEPLEKFDSTGMKRRLRKALGAMKGHGSKRHGHRGRCGRR